MVYLPVFGHSLPIIVFFFIIFSYLLLFTTQNTALSNLRCAIIVCSTKENNTANYTYKVFSRVRSIPVSNILELSWWFSGWESVCPLRGHGFDPQSRKIPHAEGLLSPHITTTNPRTPQEKPPQWEAHAPQLESSPPSPQLEKACK